MQRFTPKGGGKLCGVSLAMAAASASGKVAFAAVDGCTHVSLYNSGTHVMFVCLAPTTALATAVVDTSFALPPGSNFVIAIPPVCASLSFLAALGTQDEVLYATAGFVA